MQFVCVGVIGDLVQEKIRQNMSVDAVGAVGLRAIDEEAPRMTLGHCLHRKRRGPLFLSVDVLVCFTDLAKQLISVVGGAIIRRQLNIGRSAERQIIVNDRCGLRITQRHIEEAAVFFEQTFGTNDIFARVRPGWQSVVDNGGVLPVCICALPEGTVVPPGTPLFTIECTDPTIPWMANFLETRLSHLWYTVTVASVSFQLHQEMATRCIKEGMSPDDSHKFASILGVCDFGLRGVECIEAGARGGMAALLSSKASDNTAGMYSVGRHYGDAIDSADSMFKHTGSSIPAAEHSTITAHGKANEKEAYVQILNNFPTGPVSIVLDSYDYRAAVALFCGELKYKVSERYDNAILINADQPHTVVIRPDSGDMTENVVWTLNELYKAYGGEENNGYKVLHP